MSRFPAIGRASKYWVSDISHTCLVVAIAASGLKTSLLEIRKVGPRAMLLLVSEATFLVGFVLLLQKFH